MQSQALIFSVVYLRAIENRTYKWQGSRLRGVDAISNRICTRRDNDLLA